MKKMSGEPAKGHYELLDKSTGEVHTRQPEYTSMSLKPGIGAGWFEKFSSDVYPEDFCVIEGKRYKTPKYYDTLFSRLEGPEALEEIKSKREEKAVLRAHDSTAERLSVRERVQLFKLGRLPRDKIDET